MVVGCTVGSDVVAILSKIGKGNVQLCVGARRQNDTGNISLVAVQQVMAVIPDIGHRDCLTLRELILHRPVPFLGVSRLPGSLKTN